MFKTASYLTAHKRFFLTTIIGTALALLLVLSVSTANGQTAPGAGSGLKVSPVRTDLTINPGESKTITIQVENVTAKGRDFKAIINDFVAGDNELGQPALILDEDKFAPSHSLKRYIADVQDVNIPAGQKKDIKVTVKIPKDAAGGGYYGAVRFIPADEGKGQNITLSASVGSLILVKVPGDIKESLALTSFDVRRGERGITGSKFFTTNKDLYAVARFTNQGNIHEQPFGKVVVKKGDKIIQTVDINKTDPKGNVLPDSTRRFEVKLDKIGAWGKYTVEGNFGYGTSGQLLSGKSTIYVVPATLIIAIIALLLLIVAAIFWLPRAIRRYNSNVVRKASRR
ncbi:MAG: DUF916 domain-containing protein [Candidatus Saccharimonadales bacterium]